ncbi:MAG: single-stranded DNA-binding protein [Burkholderiaceae bacterium]
MASVNKVILVGNCGRDPEMRYLPNGQPVANISIATSSRRKDRQTGEMVEQTEWHRVQFFDKLAEIVGEYVKKGTPIYVEGKLRYGKYTGQDGVERNTTDIIAHEMQLLGSRQGADWQSTQTSAPAPHPPAPQPAARQTERTPGQRARQRGNLEPLDDHIPF